MESRAACLATSKNGAPPDVVWFAVGRTFFYCLLVRTHARLGGRVESVQQFDDLEVDRNGVLLVEAGVRNEELGQVLHQELIARIEDLDVPRSAVAGLDQVLHVRDHGGRRL